LLRLSAADTAGNIPTFTAFNLPPGLTMSSTGLISGTISPGADYNSPYITTLTATDPTNSSAFSSRSFPWAIGATGATTVSLAAPADQTNTDLDNVNFQVSATDSAGNNVIYKAANLPPGLTMNPSTGQITGQIDDGNAADEDYDVEVTAADSVNPDIGDTKNFHVTVFQDGVQVQNLRITIAAVGNPPMQGNSILLPNGPTAQLFNVTFTGTLAANQSASLVWHVYKVDGALLTDMVPEQPITVTADATGRVNQTAQFALFTNRAGSIEGILMTPVGSTAPIVVAATGYPNNGSNQLSLQGQAWGTSGNSSGVTSNTNVTVSITNLAAAGNGTIASGLIPTTFNFTVNVTGAVAGSTISNLWFSVVEPDTISDDLLVKKAKLPDITIGNNRSGAVSGSFILFAIPTSSGKFDVAGPDEDSWENPTDPIYLMVQNVRSWGWDNYKSQTFVGRV